MKITFLLLLLVFTSLESQAQIEKGTMAAGGSLEWSRINYPSLDYHQNIFQFGPQFGYTVFKNFMVGGDFQISTGSMFSSTTAYIAPFARYYWKNIFVQGAYGFVVPQASSYSSLVEFKLGYALFLNPNVALEPALYYSQYFNSGPTRNDFGFKVGFQFYFNR